MLWKVPQCLSKTWTRSEEVLNFLPSKVTLRNGRNAPSAKTGHADDVSYFFLAFSPLSLQPWSTNSSAMWLWTSATGIIKLTRNWPALASGSTLGDGNSLCLRSPRRAPLHQCDAVLDFGPICARRSVWNRQRVGIRKVQP